MQLALIAGNENPRNYFELRGLRDGRIVARKFVPVCCSLRTTRYIGEMCTEMDVFIGCAPRTSNTSGTLKDIERVWCAWADCDSEEASERLRRFRPRPSLVIQSSPGRHHAYWQLNGSLTTEAADRANRRLAKALGSDRVTDASRVLRPACTFNHKRGTPVECVRLTLDAFMLSDVVGGLEDDDRYQPKPVMFKQRRHGGSGLVGSVSRASEGNRNQTLYWSACRASEEGTLHKLRDDLTDAAVSNGLNEREVQATLLSAERAA